MIAYADTNVLIRYFTGEPVEMLEKVVMLMNAVDSGDITLRVDSITVAEVVWVLSTSLKLKAPEIAPRLIEFLSRDGIEADEVTISALTFYANKNVDFADAFLGATLLHRGPLRVFSFDKHFDRIPGIRRLEPGATWESAGD